MYFIAGAGLMAAVLSFQMPEDTEPKQEKKESSLEEATRIWKSGNKLDIDNDDLWLLIAIQDQSINKKLVRIEGNWGATAAYFKPKQRQHLLFQQEGSGSIWIQMPRLSPEGIKNLMMGHDWTGNTVSVEGVILISNQSISLVSFQEVIAK